MPEGRLVSTTNKNSISNNTVGYEYKKIDIKMWNVLMRIQFRYADMSMGLFMIHPGHPVKSYYGQGDKRVFESVCGAAQGRQPAAEHGGLKGDKKKRSISCA